MMPNNSALSEAVLYEAASSFSGQQQRKHLIVESEALHLTTITQDKGELDRWEFNVEDEMSDDAMTESIMTCKARNNCCHHWDISDSALLVSFTIH